MEALVLIAEDERDMLELLSRRVERMGHRVVRASDGKEAIHALLRQPVDLILTDINMPGHTGIEILSEAKGKDPNIPVVIITANASVENAIEALNQGAFNYLTKPFDHMSVVTNAVEKALEFRRLTLDNLRMAEAQKRRGDLLEDEVTDRVRQLSRQEQAYRDLLARLPQGIIVASSNGIHQAKNSAAEKWLAEDSGSSDRPISNFLDGLSDIDGRGTEARVRLAGRYLSLRAMVMERHGDIVEFLVTVEDLSQTARLIGAQFAPAVAQLAQRLSASQFQDRETFVELAKVVLRLEKLCTSLGASPRELAAKGRSAQTQAQPEAPVARASSAAH